MLFKPYHIWPMMAGIKTETRRTWKRVHAKVGGTYDVTHKMFYSPEDVVGTIRVTSITREPLGSITAESAAREGGYDRLTYFKVLDEINGGLNQPVKTLWLYALTFTFSLSDLIDGNGGTNEIDAYYWKWHDHMARFGIDVKPILESRGIMEMVPDGRRV